MQKVYRSFLIILITSSMFVSCKNDFTNKEVLFHATSYFKSEDFGDLPQLPANQEIAEGTFQSFLEQSGQLKVAYITDDTTIYRKIDGQDVECNLAKGDIVYMVGSVRSLSGSQYAIVQPAKPCIVEMPRISQFIPVSEGYVPLNNVRIGDQEEDEEPKIAIKTIGATKSPKPELVIAGDAGCVKVSQTYRHSECGGNTPCSFPGNIFRSGAPSFYLKIRGVAPRWVVKAEKIAGAGSQVTPRRFYDSSQLIPLPDGSRNIPMADVTGLTSDWYFGTVRISVQAATTDGLPFGKVCTHTFSFVSPLVLDLSSSQRPLRTLHYSESKVSFDLERSGQKKKVGWIYPYSGLLSLDLNGNGRIDHGGELFGQHTYISEQKKSFANGFLALRQYDDNQDGFITKADKVFSKLVVWVDKNIDGVSQKHELQSLKSLQITKISTHYKTDAQQVANSANPVPYMSKFWGPKHCQQKGCNIHDVFFGVEENMNLSGVSR